MQKEIPLKRRVKKHAENYMNKETGKTLAEEVTKGVKITMTEDTKFFTIDSDEYVVFDSDAINYLTKELAKAEMSRVLILANMVKGDCSVIYQNNNHPHTSDTLPQALALSKDEFYKMVRKLVSKNILAYCVCAPSGFVQKIYMLNPYVARKRKALNEELKVFFKDVSNPEVQKDLKEKEAAKSKSE